MTTKHIKKTTLTHKESLSFSFLSSFFWTNYSGVVMAIVLVAILASIIYWRQLPSADTQLAQVGSWFGSHATSTPSLIVENKKESPLMASPLLTPKDVVSQDKGVKASEPKGEAAIKVKAQKRQGVTHLARIALQSYLDEEKPITNLTKEHKIFIEDYLKDAVKTSHRIAIGTELSFSKDLIAKAISASQGLDQKQLKSLTKYAMRVPSLKAYTSVL